MSGYPQEVRIFVEEIIFNFLDALRGSQQYESGYAELSRTAKGATTKELRELAKRASESILENVDNIDALSDLPDDVLVRDALMGALQKDLE